MQTSYKPFRFFLDANVDIFKSVTGKPVTEEKDLDYSNMYVAGVASDTTKDMQNDILDPEKFDMSYFMQAGKVNYNHTKSIVGEPVSYDIRDSQLFLKAYLYSTSDDAKMLYKQAWIMQSDPNSTRRLSWSIEANAVRDENNKNKIVKAIITGVALTFTPINFKNTYAEVVKAFNGENNTLFEENEIELSIEGENLCKSLNITPEQLINTLAKNQIKFVEMINIIKSENGQAIEPDQSMTKEVIQNDSPSVESQIREYIAGTNKTRISKLIKKHGNKKVFNQIVLGYEIEKEHSDSVNRRLDTALDHLEENIEYYTDSKPKDWAAKELKDEQIKKSIYTNIWDFKELVKKVSGKEILQMIETKEAWLKNIQSIATKLKSKIDIISKNNTNPIMSNVDNNMEYPSLNEHKERNSIQISIDCLLNDIKDSLAQLEMLESWYSEGKMYDFTIPQYQSLLPFCPYIDKQLLNYNTFVHLNS